MSASPSLAQPSIPVSPFEEGDKSIKSYRMVVRCMIVMVDVHFCQQTGD